MDCVGTIDECARADATSAGLWRPPCVCTSTSPKADLTSAGLWRPPCVDRKAS